jgi:uncharacterized repeat protein (TIGR03803 family)
MKNGVSKNSNHFLRSRIALLLLLVALFAPAARSTTLTSLYSFGGPDARNPQGQLTQGLDGAFYGTSSGGTTGGGGKGTIFKITSDGVLTTIYSFTGGTDNSGPIGKLALATDGNFYGIAQGNLYPYSATFFKITSSGVLTTLHDFSDVDGHPQEGVIQATDGDFYGTSYGGPYPGNGFVYKVTTAGVLTILHEFNGNDGYNPQGRLVEGSDGNFYGTTHDVYGNGYGTIFKITPSGVLTTLHTFIDYDQGHYPTATMIQGQDGKFYGTTESNIFSITSSKIFKVFADVGGVGELLQLEDGTFVGTQVSGEASDDGSIFNMTSAGVMTNLASFEDPFGRNPSTGVIQGSDGDFYGVAPYGGRFGPQLDYGTVFKLSLQEVPLITLHRFNGSDGENPNSKLIQGKDGNFYGVTLGGGNYDNFGESNGTIFKMNSAGLVTSLHNFSLFNEGANSSGTNDDGAHPAGALFQASDNSLYGLATDGGANGSGTIFKITTQGSFTTLYSFDALDDQHRNGNGGAPAGALIQGPDGALYGTTYYGGTGGNGTIFKVSLAGAFTSLHTLTCDDGVFPDAGLVNPATGLLYGTTTYLGGNCGVDEGGTIYSISPTGAFNVIYDFGAPVTDFFGGHAGQLVLGPDGKLYGLDLLGIFSATTAGTVDVLLENGGTGSAPDGLTLASDGNFYGVTPSRGEAPYNGTIYRISPTGVYTRLHSFTEDEGEYPLGGLVEGADGNLYGTTAGDIYNRQTGGPGTVFKLLINSSPSDQPGAAGNISTRLRVGTGDNVLIGGFIVTGTEAKKVIIRGIGPSLPLSGQLADPFLELHDASGATIASNDNWVDSPDKQAIIDSTIPPSNDKEAAIVRTLDPGAYTAILRGVGSATGIALVEVYDLDQTVDSRLANISTRGFVETDDDVMIGGFIVIGDLPTRVLVRAIGPSLPVDGALTDPTLELYDASGTLVAANDNWQSDQQADIIATGVPPTNDKESAIVATLDPGSYTAVVRGVNNTTGVALVEAYDLQQ